MVSDGFYFESFYGIFSLMCKDNFGLFKALREISDGFDADLTLEPMRLDALANIDEAVPVRKS